MPEDAVTRLAAPPANAANSCDLRRVGAHPDYWYPLAWSDELKAGKTLGRRFAGEPIVLYRGSNGQAYALEDRCAHRQVPLHLGVVCDNQLKCHYHGWAYDGTGKWVDVPYLGKERLPNGVKSYPAREVDGLIFFFPGDAALAQSRLPARLGSSVGIAKVHDADELAPALDGAFAHDGLVIAEAFSPGTEVECAVMGYRDPEASVPGEVVLLKDAEWYDYAAKYDEGGMELVVPPPLDDDVIRRVQEASVAA